MEKNFEIIKQEAFTEINRTVEYTNLAVSHLYEGVFGFFVNPLLSAVFAWFGEDEARSDGQAQLEVTLKYAQKCTDEKTLNAVVKEHFAGYMKYHVLYKRAKRTHKRFIEMKDFMREGFRIRLKFYAKLMRANGNSYEELMRDAFSRDDALYFISQQFALVEEAMDVVRAEPSIINMPASVRKDIIKVLADTFADSQKRMSARVEAIYIGHEKKEKHGKRVLPLSSLSSLE